MRGSFPFSLTVKSATTHSMTTDKIMWIIAGPPGAGKSELVRRLFPEHVGTSRHVDADDTDGFAVAAELPEAVKIPSIPVTRRLDIAKAGNRSIVVESRLLNREPLSAAIRLRRRGWSVRLVYLALPKIQLCRERVRARVAKGSSDVDDEMMEQAFKASLQNLPHYIDAAERWLILDSSGARKPVIARGSYAGAIPMQADALRALLPAYPFLPAANAVKADPWAGPVVSAFDEISRWQSTLDHLMRLADTMESWHEP